MPFPKRSRLALLVALAALFGTTGLTSLADAKCMRPSGILAPASGKVPSKPVLRLLLPEWQASEYKGLPTLRARSVGKVVPVVVHADTTAAGLRTYRLDVDTTSGGALEVDLIDAKGAQSATWMYEVDPTWVAPKTSVATIEISHEVNAWECSHTATTSLHFALAGNASAWAYRVVAAPTADLLAKGKGKAFVLPRTTEQLWARETTTTPLAANIPLGHASCYGDTFDWTTSSPSATRVVDVFALLPDGSEQKVNAAPLSISAP